MDVSIVFTPESAHSSSTQIPLTPATLPGNDEMTPQIRPLPTKTDSFHSDITHKDHVEPIDVVPLSTHALSPSTIGVLRELQSNRWTVYRCLLATCGAFSLRQVLTFLGH